MIQDLLLRALAVDAEARGWLREEFIQRVFCFRFSDGFRIDGQLGQLRRLAEARLRPQLRGQNLGR